jgi:release factor glutamine methyltransferase
MSKIWTVAEILLTTANFLSEKGFASPRLEAELLLTEVIKLKRVELYVNFDRNLTEDEVVGYRNLLKRRLQHEPTAYIMGFKEFYGLNFKVTRDTLIPRPETEHLVDEALALAKNTLCLADIGCGCGAIALALAKNLPQARIWAADISPEALEVAKFNAQALGLSGQVEFLTGDLAQPLSGHFGIICANLPYIPADEMAGLPKDVADFEPHLALDGGAGGLDLYRRLIPQIPPLLAPEGYLLLEIWPPSLNELTQILAHNGLHLLRVIVDYGRQNRVAVACFDQ